MSEGAAPPPAAVQEVDRLRVFISYARSDASDFAEYLVVALELAGFEAYLDRHDIAKGEAWEARLGDLIATSDTVVFIVTPAAVKSPRCAWEVERAVELGKRLVPVQWIGVPETDVPAALKRLNYTVFRSGEPFAGALAELADSLRQDLGWLRQLTRFGEDAARWSVQERHPDLLLRGRELADAREWQLRRTSNAPEIPAVLKAFIGASEDAEQLRHSEARRQLEERQCMQADVAAAQQARAAALARQAEASRREARRTRIGLCVAALLVMVAAGLLSYGLRQQALAGAAKSQVERLIARIGIAGRQTAGQHALMKICGEAIEVTARLATADDAGDLAPARERFWELYYGPMNLIEIRQATDGYANGDIETLVGSPIESAMVHSAAS